MSPLLSIRSKIDIKPAYRILSPQKDGIAGQSTPSAVLQTPERELPKGNFEFSATEPKKGIPIILMNAPAPILPFPAKRGKGMWLGSTPMIRNA